jgi:hypothetical protein
MADSLGQIQKVLATLASHGDLIAEAMVGPVHAGGKRDKAIDALVAVHALSPYEEGAYQLNPRLREFISDHLVSYSAFQTLTRLSEKIHQARVQWLNLRQLHQEGLVADMDNLEWALDSTVTGISYEMDRNLTLLNSHISTEYGNVESLQAKIRQNTFYADEVRNCLQEIRKLDERMTEIDQEAIAAGLLRVRTLVNTRIRARLYPWTTRLNDIQREISKRLFTARKLEQKIRNLGRVALWLTQNRLSNGFESLDINDSLPVAILMPEPVSNTWHIDVRDTDPVVFEGLVAAAARLPAPRMAAETPMPEAPAEVLYTEQVVQEVILDPVDELIEKLLEFMAHQPEETVSLLRWKHLSKLPSDVSDEEWLLYASSQVAARGYLVDLQLIERENGVYNDVFDDVIVTYPV